MRVFHHNTFLYFMPFILILLSHRSVHSATYFQKINHFFKKNKCEKIEQKKYTVPSLDTLTIKNIHGTITIVTRLSSDPTHNTIFMQATKKAPTEEILNTMTINSLVENNTLTITTSDCPASRSALIDYYLIVPAPLSLFLETEKGDIYIDNNHGAVTATTTKGNIMCTNSHHTITLSTKERGSITIEQAYKPVYATTKKGSITINDAQDTVTAYAQKGKITAHLATLATHGHIQLKTDTGLITLHVPHTINALLQAQSDYGTVTSDHLITLRPQTTRLNAHAWKNFKKEVRGTLGTEKKPTSSLLLSSYKSNIQITDTLQA